MARPTPQKIPLAFGACLAFIAGMVIAQGGTVGRAVFISCCVAVLCKKRLGLSIGQCVLFVACAMAGSVRFSLPQLILPFPEELLALLHYMHEALIAPFSKLFAADEASLAAGLTIGADAAFSRPLRDAMRASGTTHLVALSGYNISIIITNALAFFTTFMPRLQASWFAGIGIVLFTLTAGAQPSLVRAACMGVLVLLAYMCGRQYRVHHALAYTAAAMLLVEPALLTSLGTQLSFVSVLGLAYLEPLLPFHGVEESIGKWHRLKAIITENVRTTIAAQTAVMPFILHAFGTVNIASVAANTAILPFVPLTMLLAVITSLTGLYLPTLAFLPAAILHIFLKYILSVIDLFARIVIPVKWEMTTFEAFILCIAGVITIHYVRTTKQEAAHS